MIVLVDDESSRLVRRFRKAPPVAENISSGDTEKEGTRYQDLTSRPQSQLSRLDGINDRNHSALGYYGSTSSRAIDRDDDDYEF